MGRDSVSLDRRRRTTALVLRVGPRQPEVAWAGVRKVIQDVRLAKDGTGQVEDRDRNATPQAASGTETHSAPDRRSHASRSVRSSIEPGTEGGRQASASCRPCRTTLQSRPGLEDHANDGGGRDSGETGDRPGRCQARPGAGGHRTRLLRDYRPCMRPVNGANSSNRGRWSTPAGAVSPDDAGEVRALPPLDDFSPGARSAKNLVLLHSQASPWAPEQEIARFVDYHNYPLYHAGGRLPRGAGGSGEPRGGQTTGAGGAAPAAHAVATDGRVMVEVVDLCLRWEPRSISLRWTRYMLGPLPLDRRSWARRRRKACLLQPAIST